MIDDNPIIRRIASAVIEEDQQQRLPCQRGEDDETEMDYDEQWPTRLPEQLSLRSAYDSTRPEPLSGASRPDATDAHSRQEISLATSVPTHD